MNTLIKNAFIVNENKVFIGNVFIRNGVIEKIFDSTLENKHFEAHNIIDGKGKYLIPGVIDDQVHFREPGLTHKAEIYTESKAAIAGGVTSFMEMPNTIPQTTTNKELEAKFRIAEQKSLANFSFYFGATNDNIEEIKKIDKEKVCGIKVFMGSSTGNMLVDNIESLELIFSEAQTIVAVHCEDEETIKDNTRIYKEIYGEEVPINIHPKIRSEEACYKSSSLAVELAKKHGTRLHILHLSTKKELDLLENSISLKNKKITAEVCVHHLWFNDTKYDELGTKIKWNPAIKTEEDRTALLNALINNKLDVIATDHAPHTIQEKSNSYLKAPSGGPLVQHSLQVMLELYKKGEITLEKIVEKMCHNPAILFNIEKRGFIREGYWADLVLVDLNDKYEVNKENILYKCAWSPFEGNVFNSKITHTFVNGNMVFENGRFYEDIKGKALKFNR
ncbi:MAG: dihydroorotase [Bacteroidales bacterium]|nr:dihydroorotase [Bacteroidales bacterium]MBN2758544.1 dihydroorotase [Bacteroidales bacterium]